MFSGSLSDYPKNAEGKGMQMKKQRYFGIIPEVTVFFMVAVLITGVITSLSEYALTRRTVRAQTEKLAGDIAQEVRLSMKEYPAYQWLLRYWYEHAGELDIEYDADFQTGTKTEEKCRVLTQRQPGLSLKYADETALEALPPEDRQLYAEITYSWFTTRIDQIKRVYHVDFLFIVVSDESFRKQFFLFSAADEGDVRGTNYEEVYILGTQVEVSESQQEAMRGAKENSEHLANAGSYMDYYGYLDSLDGRDHFIGLTYNLSDLRSGIVAQTKTGTLYVMILQLVLSVICLLLLFFFVLRPLRQVQQNIRMYKQTKDSRIVIGNLSGIRSYNEIGQLAEDVMELSGEIDDYLERIETITAEKERIGTELALAARIQTDMLPNRFPAFPDRCEFDLYASMTPAREVGGDFYDFFLVDDDHLALVIADVSGKGVPAALFMMSATIIIKNNAMQGKSPARILEHTNRAVCDNNREDMFVTVWIGILEISTGRLTSANAGHEYPVLKRAGGSYELIRSRHDLFLGAMAGRKYREEEMQLNPGDKLFLYTDGVPEATDAENRMFGLDRMLETLNARQEADPRQTLADIQTAVGAFIGEAEQFDDLTMLCLEYKGKEN